MDRYRNERNGPAESSWRGLRLKWIDNLLYAAGRMLASEPIETGHVPV